LSVVENLQRNVHVNPLAETEGYKRLIKRGRIVVEIAEKIGKSSSYVCDRLRGLDRLHPKVQERLSFPRGKTHLSIYFLSPEPTGFRISIPAFTTRGTILLMFPWLCM